MHEAHSERSAMKQGFKRPRRTHAGASASARDRRATSKSAASRRFVARPARLDMGGCRAYALSMQSGAPLLFNGNDSQQKDVVVVE